MNQAATVVTERMPTVVMPTQEKVNSWFYITAHIGIFIALWIFTQGPFFAIIVLGWFYAWMRVRGLKNWWRQLKAGEREDADIQTVDDLLAALRLEKLPRLFSRSRGRQCDPSALSPIRRFFYYLCMPFASLWFNLKLGLQAFANLSVLLMPAALFWTFSWWGGWNNSFFKGYEAFAVGPSLGLSGIGLFILAMIYVPMAQARHAMSGEWRRFWDIAFIRKILAERPIAVLLLALLIAVMNIPVIIMKTLPFQFSEMIDGYASMSNQEVFDWSQGYFFWCGLYILLAWFVIKNLIMRIYCTAVLRLLLKKQISMSDLSQVEQEALTAMHVEDLEKHQEASWKKVARMPLRAVCCVLIIMVWFGFAAQIYIAQFLKYDGDGYGKGWVNQSLLQVPWFNYTPSHLLNDDTSVEDDFLGR